MFEYFGVNRKGSAAVRSYWNVFFAGKMHVRCTRWLLGSVL